MTLAIESESPPLHVEQDGTVRVGRTRVTLDVVLAAFDSGATPEQIAQQYPSLDLGDIYSVVAYYLRHHADVDVYLAGRRQEAEEIRRDMEGRFAPNGVRERLLARRANSGG